MHEMVAFINLANKRTKTRDACVIAVIVRVCPELDLRCVSEWISAAGAVRLCRANCMNRCVTASVTGLCHA